MVRAPSTPAVRSPSLTCVYEYYSRTHASATPELVSKSRIQSACSVRDGLRAALRSTLVRCGPILAPYSGPALHTLMQCNTQVELSLQRHDSSFLHAEGV